MKEESIEKIGKYESEKKVKIPPSAEYVKFIKDLVSEHLKKAESKCVTLTTPFHKAFRELSELNNLFNP